MSTLSPGKVYFIGAGPGDPELLTIKGQRIIAAAEVILYAGSLVPADILQDARASAQIYSSAEMKLEQQIALMVDAARQGKRIARVHTGDPSIFGAIDEQMQALRQAGVPYEVVPGVSSAMAVAAALGIEFTLPEITQTLILTRASGRTPVPELERLRDLAAHRSSLVIFLSTGLIDTVVEELLAAGYTPATPIAVAYRCSWPDQQVVRGTLADIAGRLNRQELTHQGLIIVSPALQPERIAASHLYGDFQRDALCRNGLAVVALTAPAVQLARTVFDHLPEAELFIPQRFLMKEDDGQPRIHRFQAAIRQVLQDVFQRYEAMACIMASGIVVRELAPLLRNKHSDPAVVVMDPVGKYAVSLLGGHEGGANRLARRLADITGGQAVITTASDHQGLPALDILAREFGWKLDRRSRLANVMAAMVDREPVGLLQGEELILPDEALAFSWKGQFSHWEDAVSSGLKHLVVYTYRTPPQSFWQAVQESVVYYPPVLALGIGCNRNTPCEEILAAIEGTLGEAGLAEQSVACLATITEKADEAGLVEACRRKGWEMRVFSHEQIRQVESVPNPSGAVQAVLGVLGVAEPAALLASGAPSLLVPKRKYTNVTVAVAVKGIVP